MERGSGKVQAGPYASTEEGNVGTHAHTHAACNEDSLALLTPRTHAFCNEDLLATDCTSLDDVESVAQDISYLECKLSPPIESYAMYSSEKHKTLPETSLTIGGLAIQFLVDSGATNSVITTRDMPNPKLSGRHVFSTGASGTTIREQFTVPLTCEFGQGLIPPVKMKHSFLSSNVCPVNLLGRDLMIRLGISLISTPEGLRVLSGQSDKWTTNLVKYCSMTPIYVYQWKIPSLIASDMLERAKQVGMEDADWMSSDELNCTAYVSVGPDNQYEEKFLRLTNNNNQCSTLYWSSQTCAVAVLLTAAQQLLFSHLHLIFHCPRLQGLSGKTWDNLLDAVRPL